MKQRGSAAFSLVEVTLALGIAAFCLIAVFGLMPVGVQTNRNATSQTAATNIIASVIADMRATTSSTSRQYGITFGSAKTLYFDGAGECSIDVTGSTAVDGSSWSPPLQTRYRLNITFPLSPTGLSYADVKLTWPAAATLANASGSVETFAAFDRN
jgi:type II secretory pathway pseudopilin PulG